MASEIQTNGHETDHLNNKESGNIDERFEEIEIPVPWGHISGKWWGSRTRQPILALHGWQDNAGTFDTLAPKLVERGLSLLCIDLPGHGLSSHIPEGLQYYLFWDGIHVLRRIVKHFNWTKVTLIGHSLGGGIAFLYAASFPDDIDKYVSFDIASPSVRCPKKYLNNLGDHVDKFLRYETLTADQMPCYQYNDMLDILYEGHGGSVDRKGCEILMKRGISAVKEKPGYYVFNRDPRLKVASLGFMTTDQVMEFASRIKCHVLNVRARPGMEFDFPEYYDIVLDTIEKQAKKVERCTADGTHHLHLNDPDSVVDTVSNFLTS